MCLCSWSIEGQRGKLGNLLQDVTGQEVVMALASILDPGDTHQRALLAHLSVSLKRVYFHSPGCMRMLTISKENISTGDPLILQYQLGDQHFNFDTSYPALTQPLTAKLQSHETPPT